MQKSPHHGFHLLAILIFTISMLVAGCQRQQQWQLLDGALIPLKSVPAAAPNKVTPRTTIDLNQNGQPDCLVLGKGALKITDCGQTTHWQSPENWQVKEAQITDLNRDGEDEVTLIVWRQFQPWPIDRYLPSGGRIATFHDRQNMSCHVILIGWRDGIFVEKWAGSALAQPIFSLSAVDVTGDGYQELIALEGNYDTPQNKGQLTIWQWQGFSFALHARHQATSRSYNLFESSNRIWIVTQ